ncbi:MAG: DUF971 domain-containing protein [Deltaproteobacteria bacterium]|nr:DUF971 domain-containing protein [Deltaproteobacteria bacterium]
MYTPVQEDYSQGGKEPEREGIVVWDQKGLVVLWPDGHCSRFSWDVLRQACLCAECRRQCEEQKADPEGPSASQEAFFLPPPETSVEGACV